MYHAVILLLLCVFIANSSGSTNCSYILEESTFITCCSYPQEILDAIDKCEKTALVFCFDRCVLTELKLLGNGAFATAETNATLANLFNNTSSDMLPISIKYFNKCVKDTNTALQTLKVIYITKPYQCSPYTEYFFSCFFINIFVNCPDSMWNNTAACNCTRAFFAGSGIETITPIGFFQK